jgi:hypothetical protein
MRNGRSQLRTARALALVIGLGVTATSAAWADRSTYVPSDNFVPEGSGQHWTADGRIVDVQIAVDGATAPLYFKPGVSDRHYIQAFKGRNYSLILRNTTGRRVGVLIAVDGLNVVTGEKSQLSRNESMYVLGPWEQATIRGWRTSLDDIRRFVFVDEQRSYASRTGQANGDMGWIRVMAFRELEREPLWGVRRVRPEQRDELDGRERAQAAPKPAPQAAPEGKDQGSARGDAKSMTENESQPSAPGTGWGEHRTDRVERTVFTAEAWATDRITFRYEYQSGLLSLGIFSRRPRVWEREDGQIGFASAPRW